MALDTRSPRETHWFEELYADLLACDPAHLCESRPSRTTLYTRVEYIDDDEQEGLDTYDLVGVLEPKVYAKATLENTRLRISIGIRPGPKWADREKTLETLRMLAYGHIRPEAFRATMGAPLPVWLEIVRDGIRVL